MASTSAGQPKSTTFRVASITEDKVKIPKNMDDEDAPLVVRAPRRKAPKKPVRPRSSSEDVEILAVPPTQKVLAQNSTVLDVSECKLQLARFPHARSSNNDAHGRDPFLTGRRAHRVVSIIHEKIP